MSYKFMTPGKLYLIGEYNILKPGHKALVMSVDMFVETTIKKADKVRITYNNKEIDYSLVDGYFKFNKKVLFSIQTSINTVIDYLKYLNTKLINFDLNILNNLENSKGKKYGLGSSAAISVGVAKAILSLHKIKLSNLELFKLLVLSQYQFNTLSSGGDLASVIFGDIIVYRKYDNEYLSMFSNNDYSLIKKEWPMLEINYLEYKEFDFRVIYTNKPNYKKVGALDFNHEFYRLAEELVDEAIDNFSNGDDIGYVMTEYQNLLNYSFNNRTLIKPMKKIIKRGNKSNYHVKQSGGGGGDCMILFTTTKSIKRKFKHELEVKVYYDK